MPSARELLTKFQAEILDSSEVFGQDNFARLNFQEVDGLFHIEYYGLTRREPVWSEDEEDEEELEGADEVEEEEPEAKLPFCEDLADPEVRSKAASLPRDARL